jgi:hypothetical protein
VVESSNAEGEFQGLYARAATLSGLIQRLEEIVSSQLDSRLQKDVEDFDFIGELEMRLNQERSYGMQQACFESGPLWDTTWRSQWDNVVIKDV